MMRIDGINPLLPVTPAGAAPRHSPDAFAPEPAPAATSTAPPVAPHPATSVEMLVALASVDPAVERRRKLAAETDRGLTLLERLRDGLERGAADPEHLHALADWVGGFAIPDDPGLAEVARDIDLRVRVELARHGIDL